MISNDYKHICVEGATSFSMAGRTINADYFCLKAEAIQQEGNGFAIERLELQLQLQPEQILLLQQGFPDIPLPAESLFFIAKSSLLEPLEMTTETTSDAWINAYRHLLFDLEQYVWWKALLDS